MRVLNNVSSFNLVPVKTNMATMDTSGLRNFHESKQSRNNQVSDSGLGRPVVYMI